jgi:hypothetical protein
LNDDDGEQDSDREEETIGNEVTRFSGSQGRGGPVQIERMQETADRKEKQKKQKLCESTESLSHCWFRLAFAFILSAGANI